MEISNFCYSDQGSMLYNFFVRKPSLVEHLKGASLGYAPALPANIRLGWKSLPGTNALAYYENP
jgi:hypothetical protein